MAPFSALRNPWLPLVCPYCAQDPALLTSASCEFALQIEIGPRRAIPCLTEIPVAGGTFRLIMLTESATC
jgi:hypothetical protein